jgi:hypothetical protein
MRNLIAITLLLLSASAAHANPCVNEAHQFSSPDQMLTCDLSFSTPESNRKYTLNALDQAEVKVCSEAKDYSGCAALYEEARQLFKERMGAILLKEATAIADASYGDGRKSVCPVKYITQTVCVAVWK